MRDKGSRGDYVTTAFFLRPAVLTVLGSIP